MKINISKIIIIFLSLSIYSCTNNDNEQNSEFNVFTFKYSENQNSNFNPKLIGLNTEDGTETIITEFEEDIRINGFVYNNNTNQLIGVSKNNFEINDNKLYFINLDNGTYTTLNLDNSSSSIYYKDLVLDNQNNIYAFKSDFNQYSGLLHKIIKINPENGNETVISTYNAGVFLYDLNFNNDLNKIFCLGQFRTLIDINIINGVNSSLLMQQHYKYSGLVSNNDFFYAFKEKREINTNYLPEIIKINPENGNETSLQILNQGISIQGMVFENESNNLLGIGNENTLYKFNISDNSSTIIELDNTFGIKYEELIIK